MKKKKKKKKTLKLFLWVPKIQLNIVSVSVLIFFSVQSRVTIDHLLPVHLVNHKTTTQMKKMKHEKLCL